MSILSSIEIKGNYVKGIDIIEVLKKSRFKKQMVFNGEIIVGIYDHKIINPKYISVTFNNNEELEFFKYLSDINKLGSIYLGILIAGEYHYFTFYLFDNESIHFTIDGNRKKLGDRYTDFSWYYENFISSLIVNKFQIDSIVYSDQ